MTPPLSFSHWGLAVSATCIVSFLFHQFGERIGSAVGLQLRGSGVNNLPIPTTTLDDTDTTHPVSDIGLDSSSSSFDYGLPDCAQDVFLTLHKEEGGEGESACRGMLLRDDIILTSSECSKYSFTFDFPGGSIQQAVPHTTLNSKEEDLLDPRLGFLEANPPYHYQFAMRPVRRNRMFLSFQPAPENDGTAPVAMSCADGNKPIAHNFPINDELIPLGHLLHVLPGDILWEDSDIDTAYMLEHQSKGEGKVQRWWTRSVTRDEEEQTMLDIFNEYKGPPGSLSVISGISSGIISEMTAICEIMDPHHRRKECFKNYYYRWSENPNFSGMHFFDWLDYGIGKDLFEKNETENMLIHSPKDLKCFKNVFNYHTVHYFREEETLEHEVYLTQSDDGKDVIARYKVNDQPVPPSPEDDPHLYMWDLEKRLYIVDNLWDSDKYGTIKHSGLLGGKPALSGGKADFGEGGTILGINYSSGHYRPHIPSVSMMYMWIKEMGFNVTAFQWIGRKKWSTETCTKFDWNSLEIPGYSPDAVKESCYEVTTNPRWTLKEDVRRQ